MSNVLKLSHYFKSKLILFWRVATLALAMIVLSATASTLPRPPLEGYRFSNFIYPDAQNLAKKVCEDPGGTLDHIQYGTDLKFLCCRVEENSYAELCQMARGRGDLANKAGKMKKLIEQQERLIEKLGGK